MTEKWIYLTSDNIREVLAKDEIEKLKTISLDEDIEDIIQTQLDSVSDGYRAAFMSKGYTVDIRPHYIPNAYRLYVLVLARYYICTRFPNSLNIFLDEPRKELYTQAIELLKDPFIGVPQPDYSDSELSGRSDLTSTSDASFTLPYQRMWAKPHNYGFVSPYINDYQN